MNFGNFRKKAYFLHFSRVLKFYDPALYIYIYDVDSACKERVQRKSIHRFVFDF